MNKWITLKIWSLQSGLLFQKVLTFEIWMSLKRIRCWNCDQITFFNMLFFLIALKNLIQFLVILSKNGITFKISNMFSFCSDWMKERKINLSEQSCNTGKGKGSLKLCCSQVWTQPYFVHISSGRITLNKLLALMGDLIFSLEACETVFEDNFFFGIKDCKGTC